MIVLSSTRVKKNRSGCDTTEITSIIIFHGSNNHSSTWFHVYYSESAVCKIYCCITKLTDDL